MGARSLWDVMRNFLEVTTMKKLVLAAALSAAATAGTAGSYSEPMIEAPVIMEETGSSSSGIILPLVLLVVIAAAIGSS